MMAVPALSLLFLQNRQVQTMVSKYLTEQLAEELQVPVSISSVNYSFFRRVQVKDLYIEDLYGDTLVYIGLTKIRIKQFRPEPKGLTIKKITAEDLYMNLVIDSSERGQYQVFYRSDEESSQTSGTKTEDPYCFNQCD